MLIPSQKRKQDWRGGPKGVSNINSVYIIHIIPKIGGRGPPPQFLHYASELKNLKLISWKMYHQFEVAYHKKDGSNHHAHMLCTHGNHPVLTVTILYSWQPSWYTVKHSSKTNTIFAETWLKHMRIVNENCLLCLWETLLPIQTDISVVYHTMMRSKHLSKQLSAHWCFTKEA